LRRRRHARSYGRRHSRGSRHGRPGGFDLPLRRAHRARSEGLYGPRRPSDAVGSLTSVGSLFPAAAKRCYGVVSMSKFSIYDLEKRVHARAKANAEESYTRKLLDRGIGHCAKKLGEEAVETVLAAISEDRERLTAETADLLYHLLVVLEARGITLAEVEE